MEPEISLFFINTGPSDVTTENHKPSKNVVHVTIPLLPVHCGRKELVKSLFTGVPSPVRPFSRVFFACCSPAAPLPYSSRLSPLSERLEQTTINRPGRFSHFWTLKVSAYSRWALIRGWALIKFSTFSASVVCLFCNKTINGNNKARRCNKASFL